MYILTIKNRPYEFKAISILIESGLMTNDMFALVEVIQEDIECDKKVDPITGQLIKVNKPTRQGKDRWCSVDDHSTDRDVALRNISDRFGNRMVLVDFFRCDIRKYKNAGPQQCKLVIELSRKLDEYKNRVKQISQYSNLVPVITVKRGIDNFDPGELKEFALEMQSLCCGRPIAIRIDDIGGYEQVLKDVLRAHDILIYDINEQPLASKVEEVDELQKLQLLSSKVLLCSPRKRDLANGTYEEGCHIDNSHIATYVDYGFQGVADYGGLKDSLPAKGGGGNGCALALLYDGGRNRFDAYVHGDSALGPRGYRFVVERVLADRSKLDPFGECLTLDIVERQAALGKYGSFSNWVTYTLVRYVQQLYLAHGGFKF